MALNYDLPCAFCAAVFKVPANWTVEKAEEWIAENHFQAHVEEMAESQGTLACPRCARYAVVGVQPDHPLHRKCFHPFCYCPCSRMRVPASAE